MKNSIDFDEWYVSTGGDPWGYNSSTIKLRLKKSLNFILKHIAWGDTLIECGCFKGQFTECLAELVGNKIIAFDISQHAVDVASSEVKYKNVLFKKMEILEIESLIEENYVDKHADNILLVMEVLYYLSDEKKTMFVEKLNNYFKGSKIVVSTPITGGVYFTQKSLFELFNDYECVDSEIVSLKFNFYLFNSLIIYLISNLEMFHKLLVNQKIYMFKRI